MTEQRSDRAMVPVASATSGDINESVLLAKAFAESGYFADARQWAQALVKIQAGRELGFGPMASMTGVHIVNGKPTLSANLIAAAIRRSGRYDYRVAELTDVSCMLIAIRDGKDVDDVTFTWENARRAGLLDGKNAHTWRHYPKNMLFARCISNLAKWHCPDIFTTGVYADGELDDEPEPIRVPARVVTTQATRKAPAPATASENDGHDKITEDEAAALADLRKQLSQGRGIIDPEPAVALWREVLARWGVSSANEMDLVQRKQLVSYLVTQIQADQMKAGLQTGPSSTSPNEEDAAPAAAGGH